MHTKRKPNYTAEPEKRSVFFEKYACLCPGTFAFEVEMRSTIFRPRDNIDLSFDLNKGFNKIQLIEIALILDLKI